jgi:hypothetical protein
MELVAKSSKAVTLVLKKFLRLIKKMDYYLTQIYLILMCKFPTCVM